MSTWDSYIDNLIEQSKDESGQAHIEKACIIGLDGGGKWTSDQHPRALKLNPYEAKTIAECFKKKDFTSFMVGGVHVEEDYYIFLREIDSKAVYAKKNHFSGVTLQASKTAIVVARTGEGMQLGNANKAVGKIADYLESMNL